MSHRSESSPLDPDWFALSTDASPNELLSALKVYAREVVREYDLDVDVSSLQWEISTRAKRRAGAVRYTNDHPKSISITWAYFKQNGWIDTAATVRHELIHVHLLNQEGDASHGQAFQQWAERLDAPVQCELFVEPNWWIRCQSCGAEIARYRESKLVKHPEQYRCRNCGGKFEVIESQ